MHIDQSGGGASFFKIREEEMKKKCFCHFNDGQLIVTSNLTGRLFVYLNDNLRRRLCFAFSCNQQYPSCEEFQT